MPATAFQKQVREELVKTLGFRPRYYEVAKVSRNYRVKWVSFDTKAPRDTFVRHCVRIQLELVHLKIDKLLKTKLVGREGGYSTYFNVWVPGSINLADQIKVLKCLRKLTRNTQPTEKEISLQKVIELGKKLRSIQTDVQDTIYAINREIARLSSS